MSVPRSKGDGGVETVLLDSEVRGVSGDSGNGGKIVVDDEGCGGSAGGDGGF